MQNIGNEIYDYPLDKILVSLGSQRGVGKNMWYSPFRKENNASLHVDPKKNLWYDQGAGVGGQNVDLIKRTLHCSFKEAVRYIQNLGPISAEEMAVRKSRTVSSSPKSTINKVRPIQSNYLMRYLDTRKIPIGLAREYLKELILFDPARRMNFTWIGFPNNAREWAMSHPEGYKRTTRADVTTINTEGKITPEPSSKNVQVFEGFWDFLSWQVMQGAVKPNCDTVVLNSVNNLSKAEAYIKAHESASCFLDNDEAGRNCLRAVKDLLKDKKVTDMSELYHQHKDLNEMLQASRGYNAGMRLSPRM